MHFNFKERIATLVLLTSIGALTIFYNYNFKKQTDYKAVTSDTTLVTAWLALQNSHPKNTQNFIDYNDENQHHWAPKAVDNSYNKAPEYFNFNPNTITAEDWAKLGVKPYVANSILKYIEKGGKFYKPDDLYKIFLLSKPEVDKLMPYVVIENTTNNFEKTTYEKQNTPWAQKEKAPLIVDVNYADTATFRALPSIGTYLANNIVKYRMQLGGFNSINQINEVYGITAETFETIKPYLRISDMPIQKIDINHADLATLLKHPYFKDKNLAKVIIEYRKQHGNKYNSVEELKNIMILNEDFYNKVYPYIEIR